MIYISLYLLPERDDHVKEEVHVYEDVEHERDARRLHKGNSKSNSDFNAMEWVV